MHGGPGQQATPALGSVAAAIAESRRQLGCARCRYASGGCTRCRNPNFKPRVSPAGAANQQAATDGATAAAANSAQPRPAFRRVVKGKRQRKEQAGSSEPLLQSLRRQLQELHTQSGSSAAGAAAQPPDAGAQQVAAATGGAPPASAAEAAAQQTVKQPSQQQQQQHQKRAAESGAIGAGRPAKFFKADPLLLDNLKQEQATAAAAAAAGKRVRQESAEPSPTTVRPAKRHRPQQQHVQEQHMQQQAAPGVASEAAPLAKRPAEPEEQQRPSKFRRVAELPPRPPHQQQQHYRQQQQQQQQATLPPAAAEASAARGAAVLAGSDSEGSTHMEVDIVSPRKRAAAAALERASTGGSPVAPGFLAKLEENMHLRRQERQSTGGAPASPLVMAPGKLRRGVASPTAGRSPVGSQGAAAGAAAAAAAAAEEPDPRLCLWEPPASPFGLLEEELYDDPWKVLVACMLLNKTSGTQVRKIIWDLFALCPTPAAAASADVTAVQTLIQPLGLFRKRALAIQQLSQEYLHKEWRDPTELYGIGKYAADAYHIFCRGRWREVQPDDKDLRRYRDWLEQTGGQGTGLTRHRTMQPAAPGDC